MITVFCLLFGISNEFQLWNLYLFFLYKITSNLEIIMLIERQDFRIMLVENEKDILRVIKRGLESYETSDTTHKFKVDAYQDSEVALQSFQNHPDNYYDLVLTDLKMPKINGFELYKRIREKNPRMKFAFLTAYDNIDKAQFANYSSSIDPSSFISKPVTVSKLKLKILHIIDH
jgi:CheY-like chemotaxis protein